MCCRQNQMGGGCRNEMTRIMEMLLELLWGKMSWAADISTSLSMTNKNSVRNVSLNRLVTLHNYDNNALVHAGKVKPVAHPATKSFITTPWMGCHFIARLPPPPQHFIKFSWQFTSSHLHSRVRRGNVKVKCFA